MQKNEIRLLDKSTVFSTKMIKEQFGGDRQIVVCDVNVSDIEKLGEYVPGVGYRYQDAEVDILNVDHHFSDVRFHKFISATNLAINYVKEHGALEHSLILINHTDCDSVLSSNIMSGKLEAELFDLLGEAAIAADHTGEENDVADLLQILDYKRDMDFSLASLHDLLAGSTLSFEAQRQFLKQKQERLRAAEIMEKVGYSESRHVAYLELDKKISSVLCMPYAKGADVLLLYSPLKEKPGYNELKERLCRYDEKVVSDLQVVMKKTHIPFAGRWNAGSNGRIGGIPQEADLVEIVSQVDAAILELMVEKEMLAKNSMRED